MLLLVVGAVAWMKPKPSKPFKPHPMVVQIPKGWPRPVYDLKKNAPTQEGFDLGKKLFYDGQLSKDGSVSCGNCHQQFAAFSTYEHGFSHGFNNGQTTRNAPGLFNLIWNKDFMADGSILHLHQQPIFPITAPNEMAETMENVLLKLNKDTAYHRLFRRAYGTSTITTAKITDALSQFMVMLLSYNSKYDQVMRGNAQFNLAEQLGYDIFKAKCANCHQEPLFTDFTFRNIGMPLDPYGQPDFGRMKVTGKGVDSLKFRVPSLRNVALTAPYGHDGRFFSLMNLFEHYRKNMVVAPNTDSLLRRKMPLSNYEIGQLSAFLFTLTDSTFISNPRFAEPGKPLPSIFNYQHLHP